MQVLKRQGFRSPQEKMVNVNTAFEKRGLKQ